MEIVKADCDAEKSKSKAIFRTVEENKNKNVVSK